MAPKKVVPHDDLLGEFRAMTAKLVASVNEGKNAAVAKKARGVVEAIAHELNDLIAELDPVKRLDFYKQAQQVLLADFPSAFGYNSINHYLVKPWVKGVTPTPQDSDWPGSMAPLSITIDTSMMP